MKRLLHIFLFTIQFSTNLLAQKEIDSLAIKMDAIFNKYDGKDRPGCAISIIKNNEVIFKKGYGMANLEYNIPNTPTSVFDIASVSKQFAGYAIATLLHEKKISLDDDIHKYLLNIPDFGKKICIRHLVHHISGLRDWPQTLHAAGWRWDETFSFEDILRMVKNQKDLDFDPGSKYSYSNTGYNLLAAIVEKVSGQSFRVWTDMHIFKPLGMISSHFSDDYTEVVKNMAYSYYLSEKGFKKSLSALTAYGSSSLFTTIEDLSKWAIHFNKSVAAKNPVFMQMLEEGTLNSGGKVKYGYGLAYGSDEGYKTISHTGWWASYRTVLMHYPDQQLSFIILSNSSDFDLGSIPAEVAHALLKYRLKPFNNLASANIINKDAPNVKVNDDILKKYVGSYQLGPVWAVTITLENGQLQTQANGEEKFPMDAKSDSTFWINAYGASITFVKDNKGEVNLLKYRNIPAKRITPWQPELNQIEQYAGIYYSPELGSEYMISNRDGQLKMQNFRLGEFSLGIDPTTENQFSSNIGSIKFYKDTQNKIVGFKLSGGRIQNIKFEKRL
ncbi:serine hydrolase [Emticicia sp. BO119]|uniref:serine hydrolase domain-containing protein n=1 Tax=Emticicia sp. BO119 TaxID=2757768 RepID=UPI0015F10210|nr:serine hydrolase domain-containing protein [Emticicia sp. BO119]MBA4849399.1 serine hydrolase [Emticicia sp. BO119]